MATRPNRTLKIGEIVDKTMRVVSLAGLPSLIFILVIGGMSAGLDVFAKALTVPGAVPSGGLLVQTFAFFLLLLIVAVIGGYLLLEVMLKRTGLFSNTGDKRIFGYLGMSLLSALAVGLGYLLLLVPGLVFKARWSVSGPLLIGKGDKVFASLGNSWEMTKGHEFPIIIAQLPLFLFSLVPVLPTILGVENTTLLMVITRLISTAAGVFTAAMGVAIYGILSTRNAGNTFQ
jgi:hypothetical protein